MLFSAAQSTGTAESLENKPFCNINSAQKKSFAAYMGESDYEREGGGRVSVPAFSAKADDWLVAKKRPLYRHTYTHTTRHLKSLT